MKIILTLFIFLCQLQSFAQQIHGTLVDEHFNYVSNATVRLLHDGAVSTTVTDRNGVFGFMSVATGYYAVEISYYGYDTLLVKNVYTDPYIATLVRTTIAKHSTGSVKEAASAEPTESESTVKYFQERAECTGGLRSAEVFYIINGKEIPVSRILPVEIWSVSCGCHCEQVAEIVRVEFPTIHLLDIVSTTPGIHQWRSGDWVSIQGARTGGNLYIVDGVHIQTGRE